jgi:hypothetical protein
MSQVRILSFRPREVAQLVEHMPEEHGVGGSIPPFSAWVVARYEKHFRHLASDYGCEKSELPLPALFGMRIEVR